jgi:hypothetical protein
MIRRQGLRRGPRHFNLLVNGEMYYLEINVVGSWRMVLNFLELQAQELQEAMR